MSAYTNILSGMTAVITLMENGASTAEMAIELRALRDQLRVAVSTGATPGHAIAPVSPSPSIGLLPQGERQAFEAIVVREAGDQAIKKWPNEQSQHYENGRIFDNRQGWVWCLEWLSSKSSLDLDAIEAAALACPALNLSSATEPLQAGGQIECPHCGGEGHVELEADYCNFDGHALGVQFYGIGHVHGAAEAFVRAVNPKTVLQLLALARAGLAKTN